MTTPRPAPPRSAAARPKQVEESDRQRNPLDNPGAQGRSGGEHKWTREQLLRENDDDETATRH